MADPVVDQMTRLRLKMLEKKLENERNDNTEREGSALSTRSNYGNADALHSALRRKRDLLKRLREEHLMEDLGRPHTWGGSHRQYHYEPLHGPLQPVPPIHIHQNAPYEPQPTLLPPPVPQAPRIIQHTIPQQPATIIQQLPQQQPLIAQIPPPQTFPYRSGSIKEDMVELMLMQNAQMHQIIMHNMMLKALPPVTMFPEGNPSQITSLASHPGQELYSTSRGGAVYHHHYYGSHSPPLPPIGYSGWPSFMPAGQGGTFLPHGIGPVTLPPLNTMGTDAVSSRIPTGQ